MIRLFRKSYTEEQLVLALRRQERDAQTYVYDQYAKRFLGICCRYIADQMEAEDVMVEGMMKIFQKIDTFQSQGSFEGWMKRIIVREALMRVRSARLFVSDEVLDYQGEFVEPSNDLEAEDLVRFILELPEGYRTVFNMYVVDGFSHQEIAAQLGISEGTSKSQLSRAKSILREKIMAENKESYGI